MTRATVVRPASRAPAGSWSVLASLQALTDRRFLARCCERHGPVFKMAQFHRPIVCVIGIERCRELVRGCSESLLPAPNGTDLTVPRGFLVSMEPEDYAVYAPLVRRALGATLAARDRRLGRGEPAPGVLRKYAASR